MRRLFIAAFLMLRVDVIARALEHKL